jgi:hypothetical protein
MKLCKPPYPDPTGTGLYYVTHTGHRKTAIDLAIEALRVLPNDPDPIFGEVSEAMREWIIEALIQGAWIREYHKWETDTKSYFDFMHTRNGGAIPNWKNISGSHIDKVKEQLVLFSAIPPALMAVIEETRQHVNGMKHEDSYIASQADYESLVSAVERFWNDLECQEEFTPPDQ